MLWVQVTKIFQYCTCPAGRVTYNINSSRKHMHLSFKSICNKEHKGVICNMTSSSNSSQSTRPGKNYWSFVEFTRNYEQTSGIFVPWGTQNMFKLMYKTILLFYAQFLFCLSGPFIS